MALLLLSAYASVIPFLSFGGLSLGINLTPYLLCIGIGMIVSARFLQPLVSRFHRLSWVDAAQLTSRQVLAMSLLVFAFMFAFKDRGMSRIFMSTYFIACWVLLLFVNYALPRFFARLLFDRAHKMPTLFIGSTKGLAKLQNWMASKRILGMQPVGFLTEEGPPPGGSNPPFLGALADLAHLIDHKGVVQVVALEIPRSEEVGRFILETCQAKGCRLLIYSNLADIMRHPLVAVSEEGHQFYSLQDEPLEDPLNRLLKRLLDLAIALPVVLFLLPPLTLWVWLMQRLQSPGPVFFMQQRTGHGRQPFRMLKFRSMHVTSQEPATEARQARQGDDRVYSFGGFLRRTSLDEFPQFINALKGEMSIVGPRPHLPAHDQEFGRLMKGYRTRFFVKPGITGLAQSRGFRGEITDQSLLEKRIELDVAYVAGWSIWLDLQIIGRTAREVIFPPKTAY
jgi:exopolysaccharide biosynthesis polyprenyl glycosylphosphotransferase